MRSKSSIRLLTHLQHPEAKWPLKKSPDKSLPPHPAWFYSNRASWLLAIQLLDSAKKHTLPRLQRKKLIWAVGQKQNEKEEGERKKGVREEGRREGEIRMNISTESTLAAGGVGESNLSGAQGFLFQLDRWPRQSTACVLNVTRL